MYGDGKSIQPGGRRGRWVLPVLVFMLCVWFAAAPALAQDRAPPPPGLDTAAAAEVEALLETLRDPAARAVLIGQLEALVAFQAGEAAPAGAGWLSALSDRLDRIARDAGGLARNFGDPSRLFDWTGEQFSDPDRRTFWRDFGLNVLIVLAAALVAMAVAGFILRSPRRYIEQREAPTLWVRIPLLAIRSLIDLVPLGVFAAAAYGAILLSGPGDTARGVLIAVVNAVVLARGIAIVARAVLTPLAPNLRLLPIRDATAAYLYVWVRRLVNLAVYGTLVAQAAFLLGMPETGFVVITKIVGLLVAAFVFVFVMQNRVAIRDWLAGGGDRIKGTLQIVRARLGDVWHILAGLFLAVVYVVWALEIEGGFALIARGTVATVVILLLARGAAEIVRRVVVRLFRVGEELKGRFPGLEARADRFIWLVHRVLTAVIYLIAAFAILEAWSIDAFAFFETDLGSLVVARGFTILVIVLAALFVWEAASAVIDRLLRTADAGGDALVQSARIRTLLPLARSVVLSLVVVIAALAVLAELGVNIAPLIAGAGVVGLAVGFGAQTLVKDIITGAFILFEDTITVGDFIEVAGRSGTVEAISVRTIRLRDLHGTVNTIPFSAVDTVTNYTKDFAYHVAEIGVAYRENTDEVAQILREVGDELRADPAFSNDILEPTEIMGLDRFEDSAVVVRARLKTRPGQQWRVKREYNRRIKFEFDQRGIEIPFPHTTIFFGEDKQGAAPPAHVLVEGGGKD